MRNPLLMLLLSAALFLGACQKEQLIPSNSSKNSEQSFAKIEAPSKGEIACIGQKKDGTTCAGKRCGTPTGNCTIGEVCKCVTALAGFLPDGLTLEEYNAMWATPEGNAYLRKLGYTERDVK